MYQKNNSHYCDSGGELCSDNFSDTTFVLPESDNTLKRSLQFKTAVDVNMWIPTCASYETDGISQGLAVYSKIKKIREGKVTYILTEKKGAHTQTDKNIQYGCERKRGERPTSPCLQME